MEILRPNGNGIYRCINNPENTKSYILVEQEGYLPALLPLHKLNSLESKSDHPEHTTSAETIDEAFKNSL